MNLLIQQKRRIIAKMNRMGEMPKDVRLCYDPKTNKIFKYIYESK